MTFNTCGYGTVPDGQNESGDNIIVRPHGALSVKTKTAGDGFWCPDCYPKYTWIDGGQKTCIVCKKAVAAMDKNKISKIMTER